MSYYITKTLIQNGFKHNFPDIVKNARIPHDRLSSERHKTQGSVSCFCLSSVIMRRILAILEPQRYHYVATTKEDAEISMMSKLYINSGNPLMAFNEIIGKPKRCHIVADDIADIMNHCQRWPIIIPYCPLPQQGTFVVMSPNEYITRIHDAARAMNEGEKSEPLHSLCAVGTTTVNNIAYFVCAQTWENSRVVLIPIITDETFISKYKSNDGLAGCLNLNVYFRHTDIGAVPKFKLPLDEPLIYRFNAPSTPPIVDLVSTTYW